MINLSKYQSKLKFEVQGYSPLTVSKVFDTVIQHEYPDIDYDLAPTFYI
jgi:hypothetical protein